MLGSVFGKVIIITIIIFAVISLSARLTVEKDVSEKTNAAYARYHEQMAQGKIDSKKTSDHLDKLWKQQSMLDNIGRSLYSVKNSVERYKNKHSDWPEDMQVMGLKSEQAADGKYSQSIKVDDGEIYAFLMPKFGHKKILHLFHTGDYRSKWSCTTNLDLEGNNTIAGMPCTEVAKITFNGRHFQ